MKSRNESFGFFVFLNLIIGRIFLGLQRHGFIIQFI